MIKDSANRSDHNHQTDFWNWFQEHESKIWMIDKDPEKIMRMVSDALNRYNPGLAFEIGEADEKGKREFVISADGISKNIPRVESLFLTAPEMPHWRITKYRPRLSSLGKTEMFGKSIAAEDIRFQVFNDGEKIGILLMFDDYTEKKRDQFVGIGFIFLDRSLGEYDVMTKVGFVDFSGRESNFYPDAPQLPQLSKVFDEYFTRPRRTDRVVE